jgi:membrane protease YdiL (CAAX protease family)
MLRGRPAYVPHTPWRPLAALAMCALILLVSMVVPLLWLWNQADLAPTLRLTHQIAITGFLWCISGMCGGNRRAVLSLNRPEGGLPTIIVFASLACVTLYLTAFVTGELPVLSIVEGTSLTPSDRYVEFLSTVVAAPISEEGMFRGFLLSSLAQSIGFWPGAIIANTFWTSLHVHYPWHALVMTFIGGVAFSFVLWRTGSIWTCIVAHGMYNMEPALFKFIFVQG